MTGPSFIPGSCILTAHGIFDSVLKRYNLGLSIILSMFLKRVVYWATICLPALAATPVINLPANGTHIAPGSLFNFSYSSIADYGTSAYNFTLWLLTSMPSSTASSLDFAAGHYFGRFAIPNYPGKHPMPGIWYNTQGDCIRESRPF